MQPINSLEHHILNAPRVLELVRNRSQQVSVPDFGIRDSVTLSPEAAEKSKEWAHSQWTISEWVDPQWEQGQEKARQALLDARAAAQMRTPENLQTLPENLPEDFQERLNALRGYFAAQAAASDDSSPSVEASRPASYDMSIRSKNGLELTINVTDDVRLSATADGKDAVYFASNNLTMVYEADGIYAEVEGDATASDADSLIINLSGKTVVTGNGNNLVYLMKSNTTVEGGSGNNAIVIGNGSGNHTINCGDGDNSVFGDLLGTTVRLGSGNNTIQGSILNGGNIIAGSGNNRLKFSNIKNSMIDFGDGNNILAGGSTSDTAIIFGNGDNKIGMGMSGTASLTVGNGRNVASISLTENSSARFGDGNNIVLTSTFEDNAKLVLGEGNNSVSADSMYGNASVVMGNGHNALMAYSLYDSSSIRFGNGSNDCQVYEMWNKTDVTFGNGNNLFAAHAMYDKSTVHLGNGNNFIMRQGGARGIYKGTGKNEEHSFEVVTIHPAEENRIADKLAAMREQRKENGLPGLEGYWRTTKDSRSLGFYKEAKAAFNEDPFLRAERTQSDIWTEALDEYLSQLAPPPPLRPIKIYI